MVQFGRTVDRRAKGQRAIRQGQESLVGREFVHLDWDSVLLTGQIAGDVRNSHFLWRIQQTTTKEHWNPYRSPGRKERWLIPGIYDATANTVAPRFSPSKLLGSRSRRYRHHPIHAIIIVIYEAPDNDLDRRTLQVLPSNKDVAVLFRNGGTILWGSCHAKGSGTILFWTHSVNCGEIFVPNLSFGVWGIPQRGRVFYDELIKRIYDEIPTSAGE